MNVLLQWPALEQMREKCDKIVEGGRESFRWKPDDRYQAVLCEFGSERLDPVLSLLLATFGSARAREDLERAPKRVQKLAEHLGGLDRGQILFAFDPGEGPILYCGWWPWGNGVTISIRVGLYDESASDGDRAAFVEKLQAWFPLTSTP